jgi:hypothetical protein
MKRRRFVPTTIPSGSETRHGDYIARWFSRALVAAEIAALGLVFSACDSASPVSSDGTSSGDVALSDGSLASDGSLVLDTRQRRDGLISGEAGPPMDGAPDAIEAALPHGPLWVAQEISFVSRPSAAYRQPFTEVDLYVDFTHLASGRQIRRPAFWDGGSRWKVRFAPELQGEWRYVTRGTLGDGRSDAGLIGRSGALVGDPPDPQRAEVFTRGFLKVHDNNRVLAYRDGKPFYWLSDVHWLFAAEPLATTNYPASRCAANPTHPCCVKSSTFECMVDLRVAQGFSVYQTTIFGNAEGQGGAGTGVWLKGRRGIEVDTQWFREVIDPRMAYIAERGLVNAFGVAFHYGIHFKDDLIKLGKYVVARYGAYPLVWQGAIEVDTPHNCFDAAGEARRCTQTEVAEHVRAWAELMASIDDQDRVGHRNPATALFWVPNPGPAFAEHYRNDAWHAFFSLQSGHGRKTPRSSYHQFYWRTPAKPFMDTEINFERIYDGKPSVVSRELMRRTVLRAIQAGAFAAGYGANGVWGYTVDNSHTTWDEAWGHTNWYDGIDLPGAADMGRIKAFYQAIDWHDLIPIDGATWVDYACPTISDEFDQPITKAAFETGTGSLRLVVVYHPAGPRCPITLHNMAAGSYRARFFDPQTGVYNNVAGGLLTLAGGDWAAPLPPDDQRDYVLVVSKRR